VPGVPERLAGVVHRLGVYIDERAMPDGLGAVPWCDLLLLEVVDPAHGAPDGLYLLPEREAPKEQDRLLSVGYGCRPPREWVQYVFGTRGYNVDVDEDVLCAAWWGYDLKAASFGTALRHEDPNVDPRTIISHNTSLLPGMRGAPLLRTIGATSVDPHDGTSTRLHFFAGLNTGRGLEEAERQRGDIIALSTSAHARQDSLAFHTRNAAMPATHLCLVLLYQNFIAPQITHAAHAAYMREFLRPYEILASRDLLATCHRLMLQDADDLNEFGMDFYEHHDLTSALACFREGARMFSTATIPNLTEHELELRQALQTNVSAVVMARKARAEG
jgi:hypothetical protein